MVFSSVIFLYGFLPLTLLGYFLVPKKLKNYLLLAASLFFYAWGEPRFVLIMLASILCNWAAALLISKGSKGLRKLILAAAVTGNIGLLFLFKYLNFTTENLRLLFHTDLIRQTRIQLPIGISFFTFQALSYVIDVYRGEDPQKNLFNLALYISLFPQLIAGPIVRYHTIAEEIRNRKTTLEDFSEGAFRFVIGLGKKTLFANSLAILADMAFEAAKTSSMTFTMGWIGAIAYSLQIYFDFSGYSDMAIGLGRMFGFHFSENFNYPYVSKSVTEFWRRWHISLGTWFRDYVYIPLGGSREGNGKTIRNLFIVWTLTGIWHGANWTFIVWGLMYFFALAAERFILYRNSRKPGIIGRIAALLLILIGWVIFRADDLGHAGAYLSAMFTVQPVTAIEAFEIQKYLPILLPAAIGATPLISRAGRKIGAIRNGKHKLQVLKAFSMLIIGVLSAACVISSTYNPFIYFNF